MASFSILPDELLLRICYYVHPRDIFSFSTLNRRTYSLATTKRAKHNELHSKWAIVDDHGWQGGGAGYAYFWLNLTRNCLVGSPIAYYIEHLRVGVPEPDETESSVDHDWVDDTDDMQLVRYQPMADKELRSSFNPHAAGMSSEEYCKYFSEELALHWSPTWTRYPRYNGCEYYSTDLARSDLIPLLTNLQVLELGCYDSVCYDRLLILLHRVVRRSLEQPECDAFCNLTTVTIEQPVGDIHFTFDDIRRFMALPSIRNMVVSGLATENFGSARLSSPPGECLPPSCITHLALIDAEIDLEPLAKLLKRGTPLESFAWNGGFGRVSIESGRLDQILLANAKDTLVHLELVGTCQLGGYVELQAFTNLQIIIISDIYLNFPQQPLDTLFPRSVTTLGINSQSDKRILIAGLHSLLERKQEYSCLPRLSELRVRLAWDPTEKETLRTASKACGVKLVALKNSKHDYEVLLRT
ncbi:hypothetical protein MMC26_001586 [Xylographa opegraphella]|nr:hypothetical protein [Xylographa opegraphella]